ncbi:YceI family protein [Breoghania sp. L-A4]|uniref:YceI family protein n=1 Tax=Breoghania sp. L-A4 TaxID=2304600 RepID=UPI000E35B804|nr:YceI family protein [Breoghania sp. L-A4]AXS40164.1 polyisoprenoid-binding protein [Breoghania sp. L-A4]
MSRLSTALLAASLLTAPALLAGTASAEPVDYAIDHSHAALTFTVNHFGYSTVHGRFSDFDGTVVIDEEAPENSKVAVTIDTASLETFWDPRDEHLKTADFFNVEAFPKATFTSTKVEKTSDTTLDVTGDFTLLDVTKPVTITFTVNKSAPNPATQVQTIGLVGTTTLTRSDFGMSTYVPAVSDEIPVRIDLELNQK